MAWLGWRVEAWWQLEQAAGRLWDRHVKPDGLSAGRFLDWLCSFTYRRRKNAERRRP
jgi:hypothetical protein